MCPQARSHEFCSGWANPTGMQTYRGVWGIPPPPQTKRGVWGLCVFELSFVAKAKRFQPEVNMFIKCKSKL